MKAKSAEKIKARILKKIEDADLIKELTLDIPKA